MPRIKKEDTKEVPDEKKASEPIVSSKGRKVQLVKGMKDILPAEQPYWDCIRTAISDLVRNYSFDRIDTPIVEDLSLYTHTVGKQTDIVEKEMYTFQDQGGSTLALRPEFTAGIGRAYVEHGMLNVPQPIKLWSLGPLFRYEKPQEGRYRQHYQFDCEVLGEAKPAVDAQLIFMGYKLLKTLGITPILYINSIGCATCRNPYKEVLAEYYKSKRSHICEDCKRRLGKNVLRLLDCKSDECQLVKEKAPKMDEYWCEACREHFVAVIDFVAEFEIQHEYNPYLVRGLDYYTRTVFEFYTAYELEDVQKKYALGGGGRYDNLIETLGGSHTPACGFGFGLERMVIVLKDLERAQLIPEISKRTSIDVFFAQLGEKAKRRAMLLYEDLIGEGFAAAEAFSKDSLKGQLEIANRLGVKFTIILGEKELLDGTIIIRNMEGGEQEVIDVTKLIPILKKKLAAEESLTPAA